jgi:hypothetical protein
VACLVHSPSKFSVRLGLPDNFSVQYLLYCTVTACFLKAPPIDKVLLFLFFPFGTSEPEEGQGGKMVRNLHFRTGLTEVLTLAE